MFFIVLIIICKRQVLFVSSANKNRDTLDIHYFFSGGFLLPNTLVPYGLYIYAGDGKKRKYRLCPYF
jgi:hypothetical protein